MSVDEMTGIQALERIAADLPMSPGKPLANKTARIAWAMIRNGSDYQDELAAQPVA